MPACPTRPCSPRSAPCPWSSPATAARWRRVDYRNLGAEELGSVYESLLELIPRYDAEQLSYTLATLAGNERKETGSYYTPTSLVECLLDSALDPLLDEATARTEPPEERVAALLDLTVCDPACGSGHFLVAAARRIAKRIAAEETGEPEPPERRDPGSAAARGRPLHLRRRRQPDGRRTGQGLALAGGPRTRQATVLPRPEHPRRQLPARRHPRPARRGLPDEAFKPIEGDDRKVCAALKKQNADERTRPARPLQPRRHPGHQRRPGQASRRRSPTPCPTASKTCTSTSSARPTNSPRHPNAASRSSSPTPGAPPSSSPRPTATRATAITQAILGTFAADDGTLDLAAAEQLVTDLTRQYRFFHWHVEFPHIFRVGNGATDIDPATGWSGGFSCVIGNPPWERVKLQEQEYFASRSPDIANAPNAAARKKLIAALADSDSLADQALYNEFQAELRKAAGWSTSSANPAAIR